MFLRLSFKLVIIIFFFSFLGCSASSNDKAIALEKLKKNYLELTHYYEEAIKVNPENLELRSELAKIYYDFRDYIRVKNLLWDVDNQQAKITLAKALAKLKEYDFCIEIFEQLTPIPQDNEYLYLYGQTLEEKNLFPKARKIYGKIEGPFKLKAQERIEFIKGRIEGGVPLEIAEISKQAEDFISQIEDEAAICLSVDEKIEVSSNNTSLSTVHVIEKVLKERGKTLAEVEIGYDSTYERVELIFARTITKEGKVIYAGEENTRSIGLYQNFPLYSNSKAFIVSMPSVDVGSVVEYKIRIYSSKLIDEDNFSYTYRLREKYPVFKAKFKVIIPDSKEVNFKIFNREYSEGIDLKPSLIKEDNKKIYTWNFNRIKSIIPEHSMPNISYINPAVAISSFSSWDEIYEWWKPLYQDKIILNDEVRRFTEDVIKEASSAFEKAKKIYEFVAKNIRYVAIEYGDSGYEPHYANDIFINKYGDCKDQAILLVAMLRFAGLKSYPVLIPTRSVYPMDENFPSVRFNHAICVVEMKGELIFMDPTAETTAFNNIPLSDQGRQVLIFLDDTWRIAKIKNDKENRLDYVMDIVINEEENAVITRNIETYGFFASSYRGYLKYTHPAVIKEGIQKKMVAVSSLSQLVNYKLENVDDFDFTPSLKYKFITEKFLNPANNLRIVPVLNQMGLDHAIISKEERKYPLDFEGMYNINAQVKIALPENLTVKYLPQPKEWDNPWFSLKTFYEQSLNHIKFKQEFRVKKRFVGKEEYKKFKDHYKRALYFLREEIILEKKVNK